MNGKLIQDQLDGSDWPVTKKLGFLTASIARYYAHAVTEFIHGFNEGWTDEDATKLAEAMAGKHETAPESGDAPKT